MLKKLSVSLLSHSATRLAKLEDIFLDRPSLMISRRLLTEKNPDPRAETTNPPDVIVLDLGPDWQNDLALYSANSSAVRKPALIVIGKADVPDMIRRSMQAGARDFFTSPFNEDELINSVSQIGSQMRLEQRGDRGKITAIINGKGGAGGSLITSSLACVLAASEKKQPGKSVVAVDLDLQFGTLPVYFDLPANDNLANAIGSASSLDQLALDGFMQSHESGVRVLASMPAELRSSYGIDPADTQVLINMLASSSDHVLIDLPRYIDANIASVLELVDEVLIVTQQFIPFVRDTRYLAGLVRGLGISNSAVNLVVNRYQKSDIRLLDFQDTFPETDIYTVPEDYKKAVYAVNNGVPVPLKWPRSPITKSLKSMAQKLWDEKA